MPDSLSPTQQFLSKYLVDAPAEFVRGLIGLDPQATNEIGKPVTERSVGTNVNLLAQLIGAAKPLAEAGLPFAVLKGGKPIYHGTPSVFEKFDTTKNNTNDLLGSFVHFADDPSYADKFTYAGLSNGSSRNFESPKQNIIPAVLDAKNVLDLRPGRGNLDDLSQVLASLDPNDRAFLINNYKSAIRNATPGIARNNLTESLIYYINNKNLAHSPFDAIRYRDLEDSWAVDPTRVKITSLFGAPLSQSTSNGIK